MSLSVVRHTKLTFVFGAQFVDTTRPGGTHAKYDVIFLSLCAVTAVAAFVFLGTMRTVEDVAWDIIPAVIRGLCLYRLTILFRKNVMAQEHVVSY